MLLAEIGAYLAANGIGTVGTTIFYGQMPETPDVCVALFEYAGEPPESTHDRQHYEKPGLQVLVRGTSYATARTTIASIETLLHTLANTTLTGTKYLFVRAVQSPFIFDRDGQNRVTLAQNYIVTKAR
ncbi:MAG: minor capsid protein [Eubacteriales bacterium]|nr:minor capsid protein [Eubacteriales bacterium]